MADQKTCFVIMPFGQKDDGTGQTVDFNDIYEGLIRDAVEAKGFRCVRCDDIVQAGSIHRDMIEHIRDDDVAIVDITSQNANVFYELGVRHALKPWVTILIRKRGEKIPFNIEGMRVIEYDTDKLGSVVKAKKAITDAITSGLTQLRVDSLVFEILPARPADAPKSKVLTETKRYCWKVKDSKEKFVGLVTGDIRNITSGFDVWVNSENTNMQMARFFDRSVSGVVRYLGALKNDNGDVLEDTIAQELRERLSGQLSVQPATVVPTSSGQLAATHGVKHVFHVASVIGRPGQGYTPIPNVEDCITAALARAETWDGGSCRSILFPLIGTGTARGDATQVVRALIEAAVDYFRQKPDSKANKVFFNCLTETDLRTAQNAMNAIPLLQRVDE